MTPTKATSLCHEKERITGVHFHERPVDESYLTAMPSMPPCKKPRIGTGVYFEDREVNAKSCCMHPLQAYERPIVHIMEAVPCPVGQPLFAPPILATAIITDDDSTQDSDSTSSCSEDSEPTKQAPSSSSSQVKKVVPFKMPSSKSWPHVGKTITLKDCAPSCVEGLPETGGHLFCESKRTAMRLRLDARDYRLSSDELTFVEAAVQLSKGVPISDKCSVPKPALTSILEPSLAVLGRFEF